MTALADRVLDAALQVVIDEADRLYICSADPSTFGEATDEYALGYKTGPSFGSIGDRTGGGRKVALSAATGGSVLISGTATHYALVDSSNSRLLATGSISSTSVTAGNTFSTDAADIGIPDPA